MCTASRFKRSPDGDARKRAVTGFAYALMVPHYSTLCRRAGWLLVDISYVVINP